MLGRVIDEVLTDEERGRLLTAKLGEARRLYNPERDCRCFYGAIIGAPAEAIPSYALCGVYDKVVNRAERLAVGCEWRYEESWDGTWFDLLCRRFGDAKIANAIRNRVLSPRTRAERIALRLSPESVVR